MSTARARADDTTRTLMVALEPLVASLKGAYGALPPSKRRPMDDARYDHALLILLALYFKEQAA